jgi:hypothetical protein
VNASDWTPNDVAEAGPLASGVLEDVVFRLRSLCADADQAEYTIEDALQAVEDYAEGLEQLRRQYVIEERDAIKARWEAIERMGQECADEAMTDLRDWYLPNLFVLHGPPDERFGSIARTMAEPWRSLFETFQGVGLEVTG